MGNLSIRVKTGSRFREFVEIGTYFNNMVAEIGRLQEDVYKRKIREQRIQLQYLQVQMQIPGRHHPVLQAVLHKSLDHQRRNHRIQQYACGADRAVTDGQCFLRDHCAQLLLLQHPGGGAGGGKESRAKYPPV